MVTNRPAIIMLLILLQHSQEVFQGFCDHIIEIQIYQDTCIDGMNGIAKFVGRLQKLQIILGKFDRHREDALALPVVLGSLRRCGHQIFPELVVEIFGLGLVAEAGDDQVHGGDDVEFSLQGALGCKEVIGGFFDERSVFGR